MLTSSDLQWRGVSNFTFRHTVLHSANIYDYHTVLIYFGDNMSFIHVTREITLLISKAILHYSTCYIIEHIQIYAHKDLRIYNYCVFIYMMVGIFSLTLISFPSAI